MPAGYNYKKGAFKVTADFMGGVCHVIIYARIDGEKIKQSTLSHLLGLNAEKWKPGSLDARYTYFVSHVEGIGAVKARYDNLNYSLFIATMAFAESKGKKLTDDVRAKDTDGL